MARVETTLLLINCIAVFSFLVTTSNDGCHFLQEYSVLPFNFCEAFFYLLLSFLFYLRIVETLRESLIHVGSCVNDSINVVVSFD